MDDMLMTFFITLAAAAAGYLIGAQAMRRSIESRLDDRFSDLERRLAAERAAAPPPPPAAPVVEAAPAAATPPAPAAAPAPMPVQEEAVTEEVLSVLAAAVAAFLGKPARVKRVRRLQPIPGVNAWSQQGRVYIQASHNLALSHRGRE